MKKSICCVLGSSKILTYSLSTLRFPRTLRPCIWSFFNRLYNMVIIREGYHIGKIP